MSDDLDLILSLAGVFSLLDSEGRSCTPHSVKSQGLLALLATSPNLCRNRRWLQDRLWSDRAPTQGAASLRQALSDIRRCLGPAASILQTEGQTVALDPARLEIRCDLSGGDEFLEGFDLRDPEFENWLRLERLRRDRDRPGQTSTASVQTTSQVLEVDPGAYTPPTQSHYRRPDRLPVVIISRNHAARDRLSLFEDLFSDCISLSLRDILGLTIYARPQRPMPSGAIDIRITGFDAGLRRRGLRVQVHEMDNGRDLWAGHYVSEAGGPVPAEDIGLIRFANLVIEAIGDSLSLPQDGGDRTNPLMMQRLAVRKMWTMQPRRMAEADALLSMMTDLSPNAVVYARQAQLRALQIIERIIPDPETARLEAIELCQKALELDPNNSVVLAIVAYVRWVTDPDPLTSILLARRSVEMNPYNPIAWDSLGLAKLWQGQTEEAHTIALKVQKMGEHSPIRFWWDLGLCLSSLTVGNLDLALEMARNTVALAPDFRAGHRHLLAIAAARGKVEEARVASDYLSCREQDFSLDRMIRDEDYPVNTLRRFGLLKNDLIHNLS